MSDKRLLDTLKCMLGFLKSKNTRSLNDYFDNCYGSVFRGKRSLNHDFKVVKIRTNIAYELGVSSALRDFDEESPDSQIAQLLENILEYYGIPKDQWGNYLDQGYSIYEILYRLNAQLEDQHRQEQVTQIIDLIDTKNLLQYKWRIMTAMLTAAATGAAVYLIPGASFITTAIEVFLASAVGAPILGLAFGVVTGVFGIYQNHFDAKRSRFNRYRDNLFLFSNTALNIAGYIVWLAAAGVMSFPVAMLFIAASINDFLKELFITFQNYIEYAAIKQNTKSDNVLGVRHQIESEIGYKTHMRAAVVSLISAALLVGIMAVWCLLPPATIVTMVSIASIAAVSLVRFIALKYNKSKMTARLEQELAKLDTEMLISDELGEKLEVEKELEPEHDDSYNQGLHETQGLHSRGNASAFFSRSSHPAKQQPVSEKIGEHVPHENLLKL